MKNIFLVLIIASVFCSCAGNYETETYLTTDQHRAYLLKIAPYVNNKPKNASFDDRFAVENRPFYSMLIKETNAHFDYFFVTDTAKFFLYTLKDRTSLYEHYRAQGGYFKVNDKDSIDFVNILFYTPRFTREEMSQRGKVLFKEMVESGNVNDFIGNRDFVHTPNTDFLYDTKTNRWEHTENSSWKFLEEVKNLPGEKDSIQ